MQSIQCLFSGRQKIFKTHESPEINLINFNLKVRTYKTSHAVFFTVHLQWVMQSYDVIPGGVMALLRIRFVSVTARCFIKYVREKESIH